MAALADAYDAFLFDLDGVLYRGSQVVPGAPEAVARLRAAGKRVAFVTNNSGRTPEAVAAHLTGLGIPAAAEEVETSALVTAEQLAARGVSEAFVVGEEGILRALQDAGIAIADADADRTEVVVVGWDRQANYEKLRRASLLVERGAAHWWPRTPMRRTPPATGTGRERGRCSRSSRRPPARAPRCSASRRRPSCWRRSIVPAVAGRS